MCLVPVEVREGHWIPWTGVMGGCEVLCGFLERTQAVYTASALNCGLFSPAPLLGAFLYDIKAGSFALQAKSFELLKRRKVKEDKDSEKRRGRWLGE